MFRSRPRETIAIPLRRRDTSSMSLETLQIVSAVFIFSAGPIFICLERLFPYNRGQKAFREGFWVDLIGYGLIQSYLLGLIISQLIYFIDHSTGISRLKLVSGWPIWVQVVFFIITHDLVTYLIHRMQHNSKWLWRTHEAHHAAPHVDWLSGIRSHSLEILMYQTAEFLPVILLGAAPEVPLYKGMANAVYGMYIHSNLNWKMGKLLYVLNGPEIHRWHHSNEIPGIYNNNYSTKFTVWDRLFGTLNVPPHDAKEYGLGDPHFPPGYLAQHIYAFRPMEKPATLAESPT